MTVIYDCYLSYLSYQPKTVIYHYLSYQLKAKHPGHSKVGNLRFTGMRGAPTWDTSSAHTCCGPQILVSVSTGRSSFASSASFERHFFSTEEYMGPPLGVENAEVAEMKSSSCCCEGKFKPMCLKGDRCERMLAIVVDCALFWHWLKIIRSHGKPPTPTALNH